MENIPFLGKHLGKLREELASVLATMSSKVDNVVKEVVSLRADITAIRSKLDSLDREQAKDRLAVANMKHRVSSMTKNLRKVADPYWKRDQ